MFLYIPAKLESIRKVAGDEARHKKKIEDEAKNKENEAQRELKKMRTKLSVNCNESGTQNSCGKCKRLEGSSGLKKAEGRSLTHYFLLLMSPFLMKNHFDASAKSTTRFCLLSLVYS
jgi:uncharacterized protein YbbK (DUF523 family)